MINNFLSFGTQCFLKLNEKSWVVGTKGKKAILKWSFCTIGNKMESKNEIDDGISAHMKKEYNVDANLINTNLEIKSEKKNIYELSSLWCAFFKCDKSFFNVVNKYLKTGKIDSYLHTFLSGENSDKRQVSKEKKETGAVKEIKKGEQETVYSKNSEINIIEEEANHILIYLMTFFYKRLRDFNTISLLTERLQMLFKNLHPNYENKQFLFSICDVYNYLQVMNDELFTVILDRICDVFGNFANGNKEQPEETKKVPIKDEELTLILKTLYYQKYKKHKIVDFIIHSLKNEKNWNFSAKTLVDVFFYLSLLDRMDTPLLTQIESHIFCINKKGSANNDTNSEKLATEEVSIKENLFSESSNDLNKDSLDLKKNGETLNEKNSFDVCTKIDLTPNHCSKLLYSYCLLEEEEVNFMFFHKLLTLLCDNIKDESSFIKEKKMHGRICIVRSYLRYNKRPFYKNLDKSIKKKLKEIYYFDIDSEMKIKERKFVEKLSWILKKLRIPHLRNVYKKGIVFDIIEKDQNLVWFCFSYHHYYVRTIDLTAEKKLQMRIVKAMNYKIAKTHYYQFSRMKARKTRFEYIRMCRYYSLRDRRNFDDAELEGWSLPYINWYHKKNKNVHVPNYFYNYQPLSEVEY